VLPELLLAPRCDVSQLLTPTRPSLAVFLAVHAKCLKPFQTRAQKTQIMPRLSQLSNLPSPAPRPLYARFRVRQHVTLASGLLIPDARVCKFPRRGHNIAVFQKPWKSRHVSSSSPGESRCRTPVIWAEIRCLGRAFNSKSTLAIAPSRTLWAHMISQRQSLTATIFQYPFFI
jgi:hypothetical protein